MSDLPPGWRWTTLGEICAKPQYGWTSKSSSSANGVPYLRTTDITKGPIDWSRVPRCETDPPDLEKYRLSDGDIVVSRAGSVGVAALLRQVPVAVFASYLIRLRPTHVVSPQFVSYFMHAPSYWRQISEAKVGIAVQNVNAKKLTAVRIPLPPRAEQERIVAALEEHLSRLDAAEGAIQTAERRIIALVKGIILEIAAVRNPPAHWQMTTVGEAGNVSLGLQRSPKRHTGPNMRPYLRVANVFEDRIDDSDVMEMNMSDDEWERFKLRNGDVLLNEGQSPEFLGRPAIYRGEPVDVAFTNSLIRFQANDRVDPEWALLVFRAHMHSRRFMDESQITTNIAHLSAGRLKAVEFPVPPLAEQRERVRRARERLDGVDHLADETARMRQHATALRQSILAAAFSGELAPQDPSDEPASVLLERIRAERATSKPTGRPKAKTS